jgi:hypothetical protein
VSEEEAPVFRPGEEADVMQLLADEAADRAEQIFGSHLWRVTCCDCRVARILATAEHATTALCGGCRGKRTAVLLDAGGISEVHSIPDVSARHESHYVYVAPPVDVHPEPLVISRDAWPAGVLVPSAVLKLEQAAREASWDVEHTYARGFGVKKYRGAWQEEESIAVRFGRHPLTSRQAVAVYRTIAGRGAWAWKGIWLWGPDLPPFGHAGATELLVWLNAGGQMPSAWYAALAARRAAAVARAKACPAGCEIDHVHKVIVKKVTREGMS